MGKNSLELENQVIAQFGKQWTSFPENSGYYGSSSLLQDVCGPLLALGEIKGTRIGEVGSGSGRFVRILAELGAKEIVAVEPSDAMGPLKEYTREYADRINYIKMTGDSWTFPDLDLVISIGVIHHVIDPLPTAVNIFKNLRQGGKFLMWVYGKEGNGAYLNLVLPLRKLTTKLPHRGLVALSWLLRIPLNAYVSLCRFLPLPLRDYMLNVISRLDNKARFLVIYDQLNPSWAKYYTAEAVKNLLADAGFVDIKLFHRNGYSWTAIGTRP